MNKKVFITGSTGFMGTELVNKLKRETVPYLILDRNKVLFSDTKKLAK